MAGTRVEAMRRFIRACAAGRKVEGGIPAALEGYAAAALRRVPVSVLVTAEDVVAEFLLGVVQERWSSVTWDALSDDAFEARLRKSLRHIVVERSDGWLVRKSLREHVAAAMASGLPVAPRDLPASLCEKDRFCRLRVAEAAAWVAAQEPSLANDASRVTKVLVELFSLRLERLAAANDDREAYEQADPVDAFAQLEAALDVEATAEALAATLEPTEAVVLRGRLEGRGLQELADELGCAVSTVFKREKRAVAKAGVVVRRRRVGADTLTRAVTVLVE
jgi:DNA-directed RNA polymerase specialized sigma24 family protein